MMSETQGQNGRGKPQTGAALDGSRTGTAKGLKPMVPPKRGGVIKQIGNDIVDMWRTGNLPPTESTSS